MIRSKSKQNIYINQLIICRSDREREREVEEEEEVTERMRHRNTDTRIWMHLDCYKEDVCFSLTVIV